jgi:hypothetical protein
MDLTHLSKVADLCRKKGIAEFKFTDDVGRTYEFKLWDFIPKKEPRRARKAKTLEHETVPVEGAITDDEALFYSAPDLGGGSA